MFNVEDKVEFSLKGLKEMENNNRRFINIKTPGTVVEANYHVCTVMWENGDRYNYMNDELEFLYSKTSKAVDELFISLDKIEKKINKSNK